MEAIVSTLREIKTQTSPLLMRSLFMFPVRDKRLTLENVCGQTLFTLLVPIVPSPSFLHLPFLRGLGEIIEEPQAPTPSTLFALVTVSLIASYSVMVSRLSIALLCVPKRARMLSIRCLNWNPSRG